MKSPSVAFNCPEQEAAPVEPPTHDQNSPSKSQTQPYSIFTKNQKYLLISIVSTAATFTGFASNIYFPAIPTIAISLSSTPELINLTVTSYLVFQGLAPSLWGPISDVKGRKVAYCCTFLVFFASCVGLAETRNYATLLVLRCVQSTGSASTIAIGSGVIGDITTREERGGFMGIFQAGLLVPVAIGPVIGGALAGSLGWRSIFWFLTIYSGVFLVILIVLLPETLRSIVGNGSRPSRNPFVRHPLSIYQKSSNSKYDSEAAPFEAAKHVDLTGPVRILFSRFAAPVMLFLGIYYAVWQMSITAMSTLFSERYGLNETQIGLTFIANGIGSMIGTLLSGRVLDADYRRIKNQFANQNMELNSDFNPGTISHEEDFPIEKARLRWVPVFAILQCLSILLFGWTIQYPNHVSIGVPIASTFLTGWTAVSTQSVVMTYLVDIFADRSAAASASLNLVRCLFAAGGTSFVLPMINSVGVGITFTICAAVQALALSGVYVQRKFSPKWRKDAESTQ